MPQPSQNGTERKSYPILGLKTEDETGIIEAVVSVFNNVDSGKEIVRPGFFTKSIARKMPKGVWAHDWKQPIAKTLEARELLAGDPLLPAELMELGGTYIKGQFNLDTQRGREAYSDLKFGTIDEFSIGYKVLKDSIDKETGARELIEGDWKEWSPVLVGMNSETRLLSIKDGEGEGDETLESLTEKRKQLDLQIEAIQKAAATECTCCANDKVDCGCATKDKTTAGTCSCHADCAKCIAAKCAGLAAAAKAAMDLTECGCCADDSMNCGCPTKDSGAEGACGCTADCANCATASCSVKVAAAATEGVETIATLTEKVKQLSAQIEEAENKAGARNSSSDKKKLATIHDAAASMEPSVCSGTKSEITVSAQVKGMYDDVLAEMVKPTVWQVYYAYLEVLDLIDDLPGTVGDSPVDKEALIDEALVALMPRLREASVAKLEEPDVEYIYYGAPPESFKTLSSDLVSESFDVHSSAVVSAVREVKTRTGAIMLAVDALIDRANQKQEFRNDDGRPVSALIRARKVEIDEGLKEARENIAQAAEKSESLTLLEPEDLSAQMRIQQLHSQRLRLNTPRAS